MSDDEYGDDIGGNFQEDTYNERELDDLDENEFAEVVQNFLRKFYRV